MGGRAHVLHVVESFGAGTAAAVHQYVAATPDLTHHLLRRLRGDDDWADDGETATFATVAELPDGVVPAIRAVRARAAALRPDVVHAHSSLGGAFARLAVRGGPLLVHTPHCYATERRDLRTAPRLALAAVERVLGANTDVVAACSRRELELGRRFAPRARHLWVPNVAGDDARAVTPAEPGPPLVVGMGRLAAQRDPALFRRVVRLVRAQHPDATALWIGGGAEDEVAAHAAAGIEVTRWLPRSEGLRRLGAASVYVHTAAWDAAPMTLLEAEAVGVPAVARRTPALGDAPARWVRDDADGLAALVGELLAAPGARAANLADWRAAYAGHTAAAQRAALLDAYGLRSGARAATVR